MSELAADALPTEPLMLAQRWLEEATRAKHVPNPNAMTLASVGADGRPSGRVVLCKHFVAEPGFVVFFTNYQSRKGRELDAHGYACAVFHFDHFGRQVRLEGPVTRSPDAESDAYFASRPWQSRIGAHASQQSEPVADRATLIAQARAAAARYGLPDPTTTGTGTDGPVPRPSHWGGYRLWCEHVELWCDGHARLHDRARWSRSLASGGTDGYVGTAWSAVRLSP